MIIGIDGNEANVDKRLGVGEYAYQLLEQFSNSKYQILNIKFQIYLKRASLDHMPKESADWKYRVVGPEKAWTQFGLPLNLFIRKPRPDVFFTPTHYAPRWSPVPTVVLVLDLAYKFYPELFKKRDLYKLEKWTEYSVRNASAVLTISNSSKNDIMKYYNISGEKIHVILPGIKQISNIKDQKSNMDLLKNKYGIQSEFILFVGTLQPRKNIERLIESFSKLKNRKNTTLIIIGKKGWHYEDILAAPKKFHVEDSVKFLDFVPDDDLPAFYQHAKFFVLPSLYEGFGLPVLEAMKFGCPVLTSNISSLPEAGGDAAEYCDPTNVDDITEKMERLLSNAELRSKLSKKGYEQIKKFSWEKAAKETLQVLQEVAQNRF